MVSSIVGSGRTSSLRTGLSEGLLYRAGNLFLQDKILERIKTIKHLKGRYSLDELARILSPEFTGITYL